MKLSTLLEAKGKFYQSGGPDDPKVKALVAKERKKIAAAEKRAHNSMINDLAITRDHNPSKKKIDLKKLWDEIESAVGDSFPDGDPIDKIIPWFKKQGVEFDMTDYLDAAVKKHSGHYKTWYSYLAGVWDEYGDIDGEKHDNPWK